jgi:hypothetical protein
MLDLTLIPDRATHALQLLNGSLYKWILQMVVVCGTNESMGVFIGSQGWFPRIGGGHLSRWSIERLPHGRPTDSTQPPPLSVEYPYPLPLGRSGQAVVTSHVVIMC